MHDLKAIDVVETGAWDPALASVVEDMGGRPLNVHKLIANHPALLSAWWPFRQYIVSGGALGRRNAELLILRTAVQQRSWYEWASHVERGLASGLEIGEIERVLDGPGADGWSDADASLLWAADELAAGGALQPATLERLGAHFSAGQILDLVAIRATYVMLANLLNTWEVELDERVAAKLPENVDRAHFERRLRAG